MTDTNRRKFMAMAGATAIVPVATLLKAESASAADMPLVDPTSQQAVALQYAAVSTKDGQDCANCALYTGEEGAAGGPCPLFQGSHVGKDAWCSAWNAKA